MIKIRVNQLAAFDGAPIYAEPLHVGQIYMPDWTDFENVFRGIFSRRYFTNHGPLVQEMDKRFAEHLGVRNAVCVTNGTVSLMIAAKAMDLKGEVIVPAFTFPATVQALEWAGIKPVFCDVDPETHNLTPLLVEPLINEFTSAVLGVHLWGRGCDPAGFEDLCGRHGIGLFYDAAHAIDCTFQGRKIGGFGRVESFSFHATKVLNGAEGGCLTTNDDDLAARIRTVRNFHVSESFSKVPLRINGKMSEAQAAMALLGLRDLPRNISRNRKLFEIYRMNSRSWGGIRMVDTVGFESSNYQYCVFQVEPEKTCLSRDQILSLLRSEQILARRYFYPGVHRMAPYNIRHPDYQNALPVTDELCSRLLQLPIGAGISENDVEKITELISFILDHDEEIAGRLGMAESAA